MNQTEDKNAPQQDTPMPMQTIFGDVLHNTTSIHSHVDTNSMPTTTNKQLQTSVPCMQQSHTTAETTTMNPPDVNEPNICTPPEIIEVKKCTPPEIIEVKMCTPPEIIEVKKDPAPVSIVNNVKNIKQELQSLPKMCSTNVAKATKKTCMSTEIKNVVVNVNQIPMLCDQMNNIPVEPIMSIEKQIRACMPIKMEKDKVINVNTSHKEVTKMPMALASGKRKAPMPVDHQKRAKMMNEKENSSEMAQPPKEMKDEKQGKMSHKEPKIMNKMADYSNVKPKIDTHLKMVKK